ncbi:hypothetical protein PanWU01x14_257190 [Parasponia andersonii]|uniref:Uncharacterized protein n=1 Tax=Parasponia andersonii TaxID=3476 RepID=A0A2P5B9Z3_PARAD|nr:hypothetical protein PanWU01x14_257190 [Parasponia andersonii]
MASVCAADSSAYHQAAAFGDDGMVYQTAICKAKRGG